MTLYIKPTGGLCNRLRVIFSWYQYAIETNQNLVCYWIRDSACNGNFCDYYENIDRITFIYNSNDNQLYTKLDYEGYSWHPKYKVSSYDDLKLKPHLIDRINELKNNNNNKYIAVHIRRTDHIELAQRNKRYTTDDEFYKFIDSHDKSYAIYLATDNAKTQEELKTKYGERIFFNKQIVPTNNLRQTELEDAIIDQYMCIDADDFMGSGWSSYSDFIKVNRNQKSKTNQKTNKN